MAAAGKRKLSEAHRKKISLALMGNKRALGNKNALGYRHTDEAKQKMSNAHKGCIPWNKGIKAWNNGHYWPDEVRENISKGMIAYWIERKTKLQS